MLFFLHREEGDGVHNSLAIVENIVEFRPAVCWEAFYNIICPFYAFLYTQRGGRRLVQQPGHCREHCWTRAMRVGRLVIIKFVLFTLFFIHREEGDNVHNSLAIVGNIVEFRSAVYREVFYNIMCPFYAFLYTQRGGRGCAQQPGHC